MNNASRVAEVMKAIADLVTEDGMELGEGLAVVEHVTVARIRMLYPDGSDEVVYRHVWSEGVDPDGHFVLALRGLWEAQRRMGR